MPVDTSMLILIRSNDNEIDYLATCLKTLEINPPSIKYDVVIASQRDHGSKISKLIEGIDRIQHIQYPDFFGAGINSVVSGTSHPYLLFAHPDILFVNKSWCDLVLSRMIQDQIGMMGTQPFERYEMSQNRMESINDCFMITQRHYFEAVDGFSEKINLHGGNLILQMRMRKNNIVVAGANLNSYIAHMETCTRDIVKPTEIELDTIKQVFVDEKLYLT